MIPQTFVFIGRSGCGKGTQSELLQKVVREKNPESEIFYIEAGENFRKFIKGEKHSNKLAFEVYKKGELQPSFLSVWVWSNILIENFKGTEHLFFDGITRSLPEAMAFTTAMEFYGRKVNVVYLNVGRQWSEERLLARGRADDVSVEEIRKRLDWFDRESIPAIEYFKTNKNYNLLEINGEQTIEQVHNEILSKIEW